MGKWKYGFIFIFVLFLHVGNAQSISENFIRITDSLIKAGPKTYAELDAVLKPSRKDSTLMRYFSKEAEKSNYQDGQAYVLNHLGRQYRDISQFSKAIGLHLSALEIARACENIELKVYSLNMLGVVYSRMDALKSALNYYQDALALAETIETPSLSIKRSINVSLNGIGNIYRKLRQYSPAIEKFSEALKLEENLGNKLGLAINYQNIGECYEAQDKLEEALENFEISLSYNNQINSERGRIICNYSIAHVYVHQGKNEEAQVILEEVLSNAMKLDDQKLISEVLINLGVALLSQKKYEEADTRLKESLKIAKRYNLPEQIINACKSLSKIWELKGDYKKAFQYYQQAKSLENEITNTFNLSYVNDLTYRYETEKSINKLQVLSAENELVKTKLRKNQTTLLISGFALALLAGIFYILYRQYQLNNDKKLLTLEQSMLRSQMNPHFLFNSLNSIKLYIINNDKKNAVHYLNKFSKLVRKILEASSLKEISLAEELETVELYMNIENIRFSNEINFNISIDDEVDIHTVKIPSLILQPFLENALWHGLSSIEGEKRIDLEVSRGNNDFIDISITDNGVGRDAAEIIKKSKVLKRKSVGIEITKERLANFAKDYQNTFDVTIIDLFDKEKNATGTRVVLHIPTI
ncbi:MAG: tetratricopeptide repeat protein [Maribacter sp.]|nr:tetratricopeptide repeat protein [Maribacter sp.]NNK17988.1 tetratricopeptide repeat protein [Maribacter sp.]